MIVVLIFFIVQASGFEDNICRNQTILQTPGDALLTVFVDATLGPHCNESSSKGFQELTTALYVTTTLNREDFVPGMTLGLRLIDTCQDPRSVLKTCLMLAAEPDCAYDYYNLGVLAPEGYIPILQPLQEITDLPVAFYFNDNITKPLVNIAIDFITRKFETVDVLLTDTDFAQNIIIDGTREAGICVDGFNNLTKLDNTDNGLIVAAGEERSIRSWVGRHAGRNTWIILPLDDSAPDDVVPIGSYIIRSASLSLDLEDYLTPDNDAELFHSPHLLAIGKSLVSIAELLSDVQRNNCPSGICALPPFDTRLMKKISPDDVFEALKTPKDTRTIKYVISQRTDAEVEDLVDVLSYQVDVETFKVISNVSQAHVTSCWSKNTCESCLNFRNNPTTTEIVPAVESADEKSGIRPDYWVPVVMVLVAFGTAISLAVGVYIIYKFSLKDPLDGNPTLTMLLILGNIFLLFSTTPFCLEEKVMGHEELNSRKIFVATLSTGFVFSVMLSRAFFLAFSTGGVYTSHINGYLQGLMLLFVFGVQIGLSTTYFAVAPGNSEETLKSPVFIGLLTYDILLLLILLAVGSLIHKIPRNYREGQCLFFTAISLLSTWLLWILIFICINRDWRDIVVTFALIFTAYVIIAGVLLPRIYLMITHVKLDKTFQGHIEGANLRFEPRRRTIRQGIRNPTGLNPSGNPNFYGSSSPSNRRGETDGGISTGVNSKVSGYNNFGYRNEVHEGENHYVVPRVCVIQNNDTKKNRGSIKSTTSSDSDYAQPNYPGMRENSLEDDCLEAELYLDSKRLSPKRGPNESYPSRCSTPRLYQTEATIDEEDEETEESSKVTRF
ncbi:uncharacterized protein LOC107047718 isoform X2 [Diachasma alloeum]|uniref:uncharacterized protein LOC107047718 isoform X2 n=1 Tax=Diachasma alloeum TaxID=454923 RepID=UPI00073833A6|nr:uncharacterized protein LOC107047718 isoform X2 [Diachasma alloeum]